MSSRENLLTWLGLGAAGVLVLFVGYAFVWSPLEDAWKRQAEAASDLADAESKLLAQKKGDERGTGLSPRLKLAKELSLPPSAPAPKGKPVFRPLEDRKAMHVQQLGHEYRKYLYDLLINAGFEKPEVVARPAPAKNG